MTPTAISDRRAKPRPEYESSSPPMRLVYRMLSLIIYSETTPTRFMLAIAASFWAILLAMPGETFQRPVYAYMAQVGTETQWAFFWGLHAAGMWWRTFSAVPHPRAALLINALGVMLFGGAAVSIFLTLTYPLPAAIAADIVLALASIWVFVRTHINSDYGWRVD